MEVVPFVVTYNGMASGPAVHRCVEHLLGEPGRSFGTAIERVDLYAHCRTREPVVAGLEWMRDRFEARLATLPFVRFRRAARLLEVAYASQFVHRPELFAEHVVDLSAGEFGVLCREFATALLLVRPRLRRADDFDAAGLEDHLTRRLARLPQDVSPGATAEAEPAAAVRRAPRKRG